MKMDAIHRSFLRAVVALCVAAMPAIRANAAILTANNSSASMPVLSKNFSIPMAFSDAINGTTLFTLVSGPAQGTLAYYNTTSGIVSVTAGVPISPNQYFRYWCYTSTNPIPGSDSFTWLCSDGPFTSALATVSITVTANTAPVATPSTVSVAVNSSRRYVSLTGSHPDSYQPLMSRVVSLPSNGTLEAYTSGVYTAATAGVWASCSYYYTSGSTTGTDSFAWQFTDGIATSETSTVTLNIVSNSAPVANGSAYTVPLGAMRYSFYLSYTHADSSQPRYYSLATAPTNGILESLTGTGYVPVVTGEWGTNGGSSYWYYTPSGTSTGVDSFTWQISDGMATSAAAGMTITITTNRAPIGNAQTLTVLRNSGRKSVNLSYSHADTYQPMTFLMTALPSGGTVEYYDSSLTNYVPVPVATPVTASIWRYTPNSNYTGSDSIPWRVSDGISTSATTAVSIGVVSNSAPVARDMRLYCTPNGELVFAADYTHADADQSCTATIVSNAGHGVATAVGATLVYVAQSGFKGNDMFTYKVSDGQADSATATIAIQVRAPGEPAGGLVDIVVNDLLYTVLSNEIQRLKADLTNEGYTAIITPVAAGTSAAAVWTHLNSIYQTNKWLVGALFVGNIAQMAPGGIISDGYYWNMRTFQTAAAAVGSHDIWVGRFTISASEYGTEADLIRYALDANHYYRTGQSRLPNTAYVHVGNDWGGNAWATTEVSRAKQVWTNAYVDSNADGTLHGVNGSDLICELSHGSANDYSAGMSKAGAHAGLVQSRAMFCTSCSSGYPNGVVNHQLFSRGGGNLFSVGASTTCWPYNYTIFRDDDYPLPAGQQAAFRSLLAAGEIWGHAMIQRYPFPERDYYSASSASDTMIYGDLSMKPLATPPNAMPAVTSFTASKTTVRVGEPVTFTVAVSDPDATACTSPHVNFKHRVEWYMEGWNYGTNNPTYTTNDTVNSTNKQFQYTNTFFTPGTRAVRALVMDEWRAVAWQEIAVSVQPPLVTCTVTAPTNGTVVIEGTNLTITADATVTYGSVSNVEFTLDGLKIATALSAPYRCVWTNAVKGAHVLTAKATDGAGNFTNSTAVSLSALPIVTSCTITAPANGSALKAGTDLSITATAAVLAGTVSKVEFFHDGMKIGEATSEPYSCVWSNVPIGLYALTARAIQSDGRVGDSAAVLVFSSESFSSTGGTITRYRENGTNFIAHIFTNRAAAEPLVLACSTNIEYLIVAGGGGGGGAYESGGGGAGGFLTGTTNLAAGAYTVTVGAGGQGKAGNGTQGAHSSITNLSFSIVAIGGGYGGGGGSANAGGNGGSGGGATYNQPSGTGTVNQGCNGGKYPSNGQNGGGGGGAGGAGANATNASMFAAGGPGVSSKLRSGISVTYAAGGSGSSRTPGRTGASGAENSGSGGDGSGGGGSSTGGNGGSGIVIVRYVDSGNFTASVAPTAATAQWPVQIGAFTITRPADANTNYSATVSYTMSGTAVNGTDYSANGVTNSSTGNPTPTPTPLPGYVTFGVGVTSVVVNVYPLYNPPFSAKTAIMTLNADGSPAPATVNFQAWSAGAINITSGGVLTNYTANGTNYTARMFTNSAAADTLTVSAGGTVEYLVVAGGGGAGGGYCGGGGGAGGLRFGSMTIPPGTYTVVVGAGGWGHRHGAVSNDAANGLSSAISAVGGMGVIGATGGGRGGAEGYSPNGATYAARDGGSGGGAHATGVGQNGLAVAGEGNTGGPTLNANMGGGGGGFSTTGMVANTTYGLGGDGTNLNLTGVLVEYAKGGRGGNRTTTSTGTNALPNTGNGGLAGAGDNLKIGGDGGSGIVIVRYVTGGYEAWRLTQFDSTSLTNSAISGATADPDHDGLNNEQEFWAGTNPTNASSCLAIIAPTNNPVVAGGGFVVSWQSVTGKTYSVLAATNLLTGFSSLTNGLPATPTVNVYTDKVNGAGQKFYKVGVE